MILHEIYRRYGSIGTKVRKKDWTKGRYMYRSNFGPYILKENDIDIGDFKINNYEIYNCDKWELLDKPIRKLSIIKGGKL